MKVQIDATDLKTGITTITFREKEGTDPLKRRYVRFTENDPYSSIQIETSKDGNLWKPYKFNHELFSKYIKEEIDRQVQIYEKKDDGTARILTISHARILKGQNYIDPDLEIDKIYYLDDTKLMYYAVRTKESVKLFFFDQRFQYDQDKRITDLMKTIKLEEWNNRYVSIRPQSRGPRGTNYEIQPTGDYIEWLKLDFMKNYGIENGIKQAIKTLSEMETGELLRKYDCQEGSYYSVIFRIISMELEKHNARLVLRDSGYFIRKNA